MMSNCSDSFFIYVVIGLIKYICTFDSKSTSPQRVAIDSCVSDSLKNFNILHIKIYPVRYPDILASILLSVTWLKRCLPNKFYSISEFRLIGNDWVAKVGDSMVIYLLSHIPFSIICLSTTTTWHHWIAFLIAYRVYSLLYKNLLDVFYIPSASFERSLFTQILTEIRKHIRIGRRT